MQNWRMTHTPLAIRQFEGLQIASISIGLVHQFAIEDDGVVDAIFVAAMMVAITLLVSRLRKSWARWLLVVMFVLGTALMVWNTQLILELGYPAITFAVTLMQAAALALLFTRRSSDWLRRRPSTA